ncbi:MAG: DUF2207 domain-containing protein [Eggerthellaceae bacterium]|nr:DUF2207 domain-containing protein [Eggerthellaceae bacterium]
MQNTSRTQAKRIHLISVFVLASVLFACLALFPQTAQAKSYSMPEVTIEATVNTDGSLHVHEQRSFDFNGSFTCVWWYFDKLYLQKELVVNGVALSFPGEGNSLQELNEVPFDTLWRREGGPGFASYSVDASYDAVYVFFDVTDAEMLVSLDYTINNALDVYTDCADLNWQFVGSDWAENSKNVTCTITLPAPASAASAAKASVSAVGTGTAPTPAIEGDTVRAWGHGPLDGKVQFSEDATQITYTIPRVKSGEFAEARIAFPTDWLSLPSGYGVKNYSGLSTILAQEQTEADKANRGRIISLLFFGVLGLVSLASVLWAAVNWLLFGREYRPSFTDKYWRDLPNKDVHPAVISRLCNWDTESTTDVVATILHLADEGIISINKDVRTSDGGVAGTGEESYYLSLNADAYNKMSNPVDTELVNFLFGEIAKKEDVLWLDEIDEWGERHKRSFDSRLKKWHKVLSREVKKQDYFEEKGEEKSGTAATLGMLLIAAGIFISVELENWWPIIFFVIAAAVVFLFGFFMPRRTRQGAEDYARAKALKRWLKDFTALEESIPTDVKVWGHFMVYAFIFGVAAQTLKQLRGVVPELFAGDTQAAGGSSLPWHTWYVSDSFTTSTKDSFTSTFDSMWSNTAALAEAAARPSGSGGGWSSGGGFSGGFSGGGGGGFGGGGGGAR